MQQKNKFDKETVAKIAKGAGWALSGSLGITIMALATKAPQNTWWGVAIAWGVPTTINVIREYMKGYTIKADE